MKKMTLDYLLFHSGSEDYLHAVRGTDSLSTEKRELEKAASNSQFIKTMFATQQLRTSQNPIPTNKSTVSQFLEEKDSEKVSENTETIKARAVQDLDELMSLKIEQLEKYGAVLIPHQKPWKKGDDDRQQQS